MAAEYIDPVIFPDPNPGITDALVGHELRRVMESLGDTAVMIFQAEVGKDSGRLAASAHAHVELGGVDNDRWVTEMVVGGAGARGQVDYAAAYTFGADVVTPGGKRHEDANVAHKAMQRVLDQIGKV